MNRKELLNGKGNRESKRNPWIKKELLNRKGRKEKKPLNRKGFLEYERKGRNPWI